MKTVLMLATQPVSPTESHTVGQIYTVADDLAERYTGMGVARLVGDQAAPRRVMVNGVWTTTPSVFRLRLTGTGTVTIDARDSLGNITPNVASYTVSGATDQIEFPYAGDNAVAIRAALTGTATAEVI